MLHIIKPLPDDIEQGLARVAMLQVALLHYAANGGCLGGKPASQGTSKTSTLTKQAIDSFTEHLQSSIYPAYFQGREAEIAAWCWHGPSDHKGQWRRKHLELLHNFAKLSSVEQQAAQTWLKRIAQEVQDLLEKEKQAIQIASFFTDEQATHFQNKKPCTWQGAAYDFFLYFYETFLGNNEQSSTFPGVLTKNNKPFGRQAFLKAFITANQELMICPVCDSSRYYTQTGNTISATIDHFLPKSLYPHLACHPANLIPICHACNSLKSSKDPVLIGSKDSIQKKTSLDRSLLPYTQTQDKSYRYYLQVTLKAKTTSVKIGEIIAYTHENTKAPDSVQQRIKLLKGIYNIPERWEADTVGETLFRRMRQYMNNWSIVSDEDNLTSEIYNSLTHLLYYLDQEDSRRDPLSFALTWMLVAFINEQLLTHLPPTHKNAKQSSNINKDEESYLLKEIKSWFNQNNIQEAKKRSKQASNLLSIVEKGIEHHT